MALWNNKEVDQKINQYTVELEQKITELEQKLLAANTKIGELDQQLEQRTADFETRIQGLQAQLDEQLVDKGAKIQEQAAQTANQAKDFVAEKLGQASNHLNDVDFREVGEKLQEKGNKLFEKFKTMTKAPADSSTANPSPTAEGTNTAMPSEAVPTPETDSGDSNFAESTVVESELEPEVSAPTREENPIQAKETVVVDQTADQINSK
ncbi:MAG: hypothetical protein ACRCWD_00685 [Culicoidibacterales bacterium]